MLVPFRGSELYNVCKQNGLISDKTLYFSGQFNDNESVLNFSKEYKQELKGLIKTFNLYIKLPEKYYPQIKIAERPDQEGNAIFEHLSKILEEGSS
jgi:hypothetical protein